MATAVQMDISACEGQFTMSLDSQWNNNHNNNNADHQTNAGESYVDLIHEDFSQNENIGKASKRTNIGPSEKNPTSVARRNARERRRIKNVNSAFDELRQHVPNGERNRKKISKVDTLQSAIEYIKALEELVRSRNRENNTKKAELLESDKENVPCDNNLPADDDQIDYEGSSCSPSGPESDDVIFVGSSANASQVRPTCGSESRHSEHSENDFDDATSAGKKRGKNAKQSSPVVLTESMLKAFDVMLEKCGSKKSKKDVAIGQTDVGANGQLLDVNNNNLQLSDATQYDMQSQSSDSGFSDVFVDHRDIEAADPNVTLPRQRQSSLQLCFQGNADTRPDFELAASPILAEPSYQISDLSLSSLQVQSPVNEPTFTVLSPHVTHFNEPAYGQPMHHYANHHYGFQDNDTQATDLQNRCSHQAENYFNFNNITPSAFDDKPETFDSIFPQNTMPNWLSNPELTTLEQINPTLNVLPSLGVNLEPVFQKTAAVFSAEDWNGAL